MNASVPKWLSEAAKERGAQARLARATGIPPDVLSKILAGNRGLKHDEAEALRAAVQSLPQKSHADPGFLDLVPVPIEARVEAGLFKASNQLPPEDRGIEHISGNSPYARFPLVGLQVAGESMNEFYPHGSVVIVVPAVHLGEGWMPDSGQHVIVQRLNDWNESELTIKEIRYGPGPEPEFLELWPRSRHPDFQKPWSFPIRRDEEAGDQEKMRIIGLVIRGVTPAPGV